MVFEEEMNEKSHLGKFFFAALSGIFLYISLTSFFPVLQALIDQAGKLPVSRPSGLSGKQFQILWLEIIFIYRKTEIDTAIAGQFWVPDSDRDRATSGILRRRSSVYSNRLYLQSS